MGFLKKLNSEQVCVILNIRILRRKKLTKALFCCWESSNYVLGFSENPTERKKQNEYSLRKVKTVHFKREAEKGETEKENHNME